MIRVTPILCLLTYVAPGFSDRRPEQRLTSHKTNIDNRDLNSTRAVPEDPYVADTSSYLKAFNFREPWMTFQDAMEALDLYFSDMFAYVRPITAFLWLCY